MVRKRASLSRSASSTRRRREMSRATPRMPTGCRLRSLAKLALTSTQMVEPSRRRISSSNSRTLAGSAVPSCSLSNSSPRTCRMILRDSGVKISSRDWDMVSWGLKPRKSCTEGLK